MPPKQPLEKTSWQWAETTDPDSITLEHIRVAYRLNLPFCTPGGCSRNCKGNPHCLNGLGEKVWFGEIEDKTWHDVEDPEEERRKPTAFVGLKNLGATCYVNTFLQLWFMNDHIQEGIFKWREVDAKAEGDQDWKPSSVCAHLQVIFAQLHLSKRRYIDPSPLIEHLGLNAGEQQDAQEFSKLFLSMLESSLMDSVAPNPRNVIKEQFCGTYAYVTKCSNCNTLSERLSDFYELDLNIRGHKSLDDALKGFLEIEKLEGDNQYMCQRCNGKQNATRAIVLKSLPPVLNLQLLRFVFESGVKKKLSSCIQFPDVLDIRDLVPGDPNAVYELTAVLIHRGPSAYSGHYVAHIKGKDNQAWYKFNDEEVERIKGRNLQLGSEEEITDPKQKKSPRTPKGHHSSRNAYMLVYTKVTGPICGLKEEGIAIKAESSAEKNSFTELIGKQHTNSLSGNIPVQKVSAMIYTEVKLSDGSIPSSNRLNAEWSNEFKQDSKCSCSDFAVNCYHNSFETYSNNLPATSTSEVVTSGKTFNGGDCISKSEPKVSNHTRNNVNSKKLNLDNLPDHVKNYVDKDNESFEKWINEMNSLKENNIRSGREKQENIKTMFRNLFTVENGSFEWIPQKWLTKWLNDPQLAPAIDNTEILCKHGCVCPDQVSKIKCVSVDGGDNLFALYGGDVRCQNNSSLCEMCVKQKCEVIRTKAKMTEDDKIITAEMKTDLNDKPYFWIGKGSFRSWKRLALERLSDNVCVAKSASKETSPQKAQGEHNKVFETDSDDETVGFNEDLLCSGHGGLDPDSSSRKLIPESVWLKLKAYFPGCPEFPKDAPICTDCQNNIYEEEVSKDLNKQIASEQKLALIDLFHDRKRPTSVQSSDEGIYVVNSIFLFAWKQFIKEPSKMTAITEVNNKSLLCNHGLFVYPPENDSTLKSDDRVAYLWPREWLSIQKYYTVDVEIVLMSVHSEEKRETIIVPNVCDECLISRLNEEENEIYDYKSVKIYVRKADKKVKTNQDGEDSRTDDPDFTNNPSSSEKKRKSCSDTQLEPLGKIPKTSENATIIRKSQRHRKQRGEKELIVSSNDTLKDLKLQIMKEYSVPPFDQNLTMSGIALIDNEATLKELKIPPGAVIDLVADEPQEDAAFLEEACQVAESGFKGTNLLSA